MRQMIAVALGIVVEIADESTSAVHDPRTVALVERPVGARDVLILDFLEQRGHGE